MSVGRAPVERFLESHAISPLDGRYRPKTEPLATHFSEFALMRARCVVELRYLQALNETGLFPTFSQEESSRIEEALASFTDGDYGRIKEIERRTMHDVKACEFFLGERLRLSAGGMIHFGLTSEDVNNLAYSALLKEFSDACLLPRLVSLVRALAAKTTRWRDIAFPARTHGQKASPSTLGKEMAVFVQRLLRQHERLESLRFRGKLGGATGTGAAWRAAFPGFDWLSFSARFVRSLGLDHALATTQVEGCDGWAEFFCAVGRINGIVRDLDIDIWLYEMLGYLGEGAGAGEVGSSTMPHKVNPIRFENSEGNLHVADALLTMLSRELTHSRLQRDLSGSTLMRNIGVALAHTMLAWDQALEGLGRLEARPGRCAEDLDASIELLAEPLQTILRAEGVADAYDMVRLCVQGRSMSREDLEAFIDTVPVHAQVKARLRALQPRLYTGYAGEICDAVLAQVKSALGDAS